MMDDEELLTGFLEEAREHIETIEPDLLALESDPTDMDIINRLFRSVHSIKGGAGFFGLDKMNILAHAMESLMSKARTSKLVIGKKHTDGLLLGLDRLTVMVDDISGIEQVDIENELRKIEALNTDNDLELVSSPGAKGPDPIDPIAEPVSPANQANVIPEFKQPALPVVDTEPFLDTFNIPEEEIDRLIGKGMNIYAISLGLNGQILSKDKTPADVINSLEELGWFIDSYIDVETDDDLNYVFTFATIMEPQDAAVAVNVDDRQLRSLDVKLYKARKNAGDFSGIPQSAESPPDVIQADIILPPEAEEAKAQSVEIIPIKKESPSPLPALVDTKETKKSESVKSIKTEESVRVSVGKLNQLVDLAGELVLVRNRILQLGETEGRKIPGFSGIVQNLNMVTSGLQEEILNTRMQPISTVFGKFPRLIRELGTSLGKEINLITEGNEVELDKTVLEALSDPLTHIVRNTADHGIELPEERLASGKERKGELKLKAYHESGQVIIIIKDDGAGINPETISLKAFEKGLISRDQMEGMDDRDKINLIFLPGFSTAKTISSVSGRGVGMDVVRSNIEGIGGTVELKSVFGNGTTLKMTLPLTMAIVSCLIVQVEKERFAIPQVNLEELVIVKPGEYKSLIGYIQDREVLRIRGELLPLISLAKGLGLVENQGKSRPDRANEEADTNTRENETDAVRILIVSSGANRVGVMVDSILGTEEIVVKPMPEYLSQVVVFSGATILGDGTVAMIVDTNAFIQENHLSDIEKKSDGILTENTRRSFVEQQSILIFDNGTEERFAVNIPLIQRVDTISLNQIQNIGDKEYTDYRGQQLRILRLADYLPIQQPKYDSEYYNIIIPKETRIPVAILINKVLDTRTLSIDLSEGTIHDKGIHGSTLIDGKITLLLDLYTLLELGEPESLYRVSFEKEKLKNTRVLLAEDTPMFLAVIKEYLESARLNVTAVVNGKQALEMLKEKHFDLVLSDIEMPEMDGFGLIREIRKSDRLRSLPVIALTSLDDEETIQAGMDAGFNDWIVKLDKHKILSSISRHLDFPDT